MAKAVDKKFCWEIKNFSSINSERCHSVPVVIGDCKWRLVAFPKGYKADYLSLYLEVADFKSLPSGWRRYTQEVAQQVKESIDVNGFQVLPSQVESVRRIFKKHPDIAVGFQVKNQHLRKTFMSFLVNVIETMCQSLQELSNEDLVEVDIALTYLKDAGFKVDWLEKKLDHVKEKKEKEQSGLVILQGIEQQLHELMHKCEEKKSEVLSVGAPLKFDDVV
ncbi:unnamed protein product [Arabidopsis thaliana]|uniref:(thale cress) hypothetical protein n=1 Tax=Arabidopsis thaliana TaxID=3702 RepID=A0A7G2EW11_ARATH|nr:unnamed protein product [Arabidopsis thaliana]